MKYASFLFISCNISPNDFGELCNHYKLWYKVNSREIERLKTALNTEDTA